MCRYGLIISISDCHHHYKQTALQYILKADLSSLNVLSWDEPYILVIQDSKGAETIFICFFISLYFLYIVGVGVHVYSCSTPQPPALFLSKAFSAELFWHQFLATVFTICHNSCLKNCRMLEASLQITNLANESTTIIDKISLCHKCLSHLYLYRHHRSRTKFRHAASWFVVETQLGFGEVDQGIFHRRAYLLDDAWELW